MTGGVRALWEQPAVAWVTLVVVVVVGVLALGRPARQAAPLDPASTEPLGTRALVLLAERLGAQVDMGEASALDDHDVIVVMADQLDDAGRAALQDQVEAGSTLVVADPRSPLNPFPVGSSPGAGLADEPFDDECAIPALAGVGHIEPPPGSVAYRSPGPGTELCFSRDDAAFVAVAAVGRGTVVAVGGAGVFTNQAIGRSDNAVLAAALLVPRPGTRVAFVRIPTVGSGDRGLSELVGDNVKASLWQLGLAFGVYALWRARRLGRPVEEGQPVTLEASELVVAVGHLLGAAGHYDEAARLVGDDLRRHLAKRLGLAGAASTAEVAEVAAARTAIPAERILAAMSPPPLTGADALVTHVAEAEAIGREVVHA